MLLRISSSSRRFRRHRDRLRARVRLRARARHLEPHRGHVRATPLCDPGTTRPCRCGCAPICASDSRRGEPWRRLACAPASCVLRARVERAGATRDVRRRAGPASRHAAYWHDWISRGRFPDHPWQIHCSGRALTLKAWRHAPTDAMMAAATTSLPETAGRTSATGLPLQLAADSTFMLWALSTLGRDREAATTSTSSPTERKTTTSRSCTASTAPAARGGDPRSPPATKAPVRSGSATTPGAHAQHDVWACCSTPSGFTRGPGSPRRPPLVPLLTRQVDTALDRWREADRRHREMRGSREHFTPTKVFARWPRPRSAARHAPR